MAWTAPRSYTTGEMITAAILNTHWRDNLLVLDTHVHSGAAGDGSATPGPLTYADFTDQASIDAPSAGRTRLAMVSGAPKYRANGGAEIGLSTDTHVHGG